MCRESGLGKARLRLPDTFAEPSLKLLILSTLPLYR